VSASVPLLNASEAARRLGVSVKALRLYEQRGLMTPARTAAGYRIYSPDDMARAADIVALRALGLTLSQVEKVLEGDSQSLERALAAHEATLEGEVRKLVNTISKVRRIRADLGRGQVPVAGELAPLLKPCAEFNVAFELPWPWGGERFEVGDIRRINYIVGPLGSGKTRLAQRLAETLPGGAFLGLERLHTEPADLDSSVEQILAWLVDEGATVSNALVSLLIELEAKGPTVLVVDMVEQGLDRGTQEALIAYLRQRARSGARPLFLMTRSSAILDLDAVGPDEAILLCPANHSPPIWVAPYAGASGYEAVATCLASPDVRARTRGMIAAMGAQLNP
jgi:DNA-binding transcriptional MerR regulator